jgi:hopanoid-associated phosphorylase
MIVVVGLAFEARIAAGPGMNVICSGDGQDLAGSVTRAITPDCRGLVSFGVAGGLDPNLKPGACVVASAIVSGNTRMPTDHHWSQQLIKTIPDAVYGILAGVRIPVAEPSAKRALHEKTGAIAVDMESHVVAKVAAAHGLPMAAIRVITDPAMRALPEAVLAAMRPDGTTSITALIRSLMRKPRELPALVQTALDARAARSTLLRGRQLLGPGLGLPNFG